METDDENEEYETGLARWREVEEKAKPGIESLIQSYADRGFRLDALANILMYQAMFLYQSHHEEGGFPRTTPRRCAGIATDSSGACLSQLSRKRTGV